MISRRTIIYILVTTALLSFSIFAFIFPTVKPPLEGEFTIKWSRPSGLRFDDLKRDDTLKIHFECDLSVGIYLLPKATAEEFRSPSFYKEPLPPPNFVEKEGDILITVTEDGDYELLFWNESFTSDHTIKYSIRTHLHKDFTISIISGTSLLFLSCVPPVIWFLKRNNIEKSPPERERFK